MGERDTLFKACLLFARYEGRKLTDVCQQGFAHCYHCSSITIAYKLARGYKKNHHQRKHLLCSETEQKTTIAPTVLTRTDTAVYVRILLWSTNTQNHKYLLNLHYEKLRRLLLKQYWLEQLDLYSAIPL